MPEPLGLRAAARAVPIDHGQLKRLADRGQVPRGADGMFDVEAVRKALTSNVDQALRRGGDQSALGGVSPVTSHHLKARKTKAPIIRTEADAKDAVALIASVLKAEGIEPGAIDFNAARTADVILKARERDLNIAQRRKELVPHVLVSRHIDKVFGGFKKVMQRMPSRHVPEMAAVLGCDASLLDALMSKAVAAELNGLSAPVVRT